VSSGFADRGLTTWLPRRTRLPDLIRWLSIVFVLSLVANFPKLFEYHRISGRELRIVPYNETGHTSTIWMATKSTASESGYSLRTWPRPIGNSPSLQSGRKKDGLDISLELRVMAVTIRAVGIPSDQKGPEAHLSDSQNASRFPMETREVRVLSNARTCRPPCK
jgi:hypothetical protein